LLLQNVTVLRTGENSIDLSWQCSGDSLKVRVFHGHSADTIDRHTAVCRATGSSCQHLNNLDARKPHFFELVTGSGQRLVAGERRVPLEGAVNFRDLGGYETADGRRLKWGLIFRSDNLAKLTDADLNLLSQLGIRAVCDFRTLSEVDKSPNRFHPLDIGQDLKFPIQQGKFDPVDAFERIKKGEYDWITEGAMLDGYITNIDEFSGVWKQIFTYLAEKEYRPLVFHCTAGKDRTGICAALILLYLGVPEETVIEDYVLSNAMIAGVLEKINEQIIEMGLDLEKLHPYMTVNEGRMTALIKHINQTYGSVSDYLRSKAGVDKRVLESLRDQLLE